MATSVSEYCKLVFDISQQLTERDVEALEYIYKVNSVEKATSLGVLKKLESRGIFSSSNIQGLKAMLRTIDRCDLLDLLRGVEDRRLELCYVQALSLEGKIEAILGKMVAFCGKQQCSPTERSFCSRLKDEVQSMQRDMKEFLIKPLGEVCKSATGCQFSTSSPDSALPRSKSTGDSIHQAKTNLPILRPQQRVTQSLANLHFPANQGTVQQQQQSQQNDCGTSLEDCDYDVLLPASADDIGVRRSVPPYASTNLLEHSPNSSRNRRMRQSPLNLSFDGKKAVDKNMTASVPSSPSFMQKALKRSSSSDNLLLGPLQVSKLPILKKKLSSKHSSGSEADTSGSADDSGFNDASEFALFKMDASRTSESPHIYTRPIKNTANTPTVYSVPVKRN